MAREEVSSRVQIPGGYLNRVATMKKKYSQMNLPSPCIFKFSPGFTDIKGGSNMPQEVSIGPYHRGKLELSRMDELKWHYLFHFLHRSGVDLEFCLKNVGPLEQEARNCYSETILFSTDEFLEMMVVDGCFVLQVILFLYAFRMGEKSVTESHPLAQMKRTRLRKIFSDLLLLENQIPRIILESLYEVFMMTSGGTAESLSSICVRVFPEILGIQYNNSTFDEVKWLDLSTKIEWLHLLDLSRSLFIPSSSEVTPWNGIESPLELWHSPACTIPCVSRLRRAGVRISRNRERSLVVKFLDGVIQMPSMILNDLTCTFLVNCVAFEQGEGNRSKHFSVYAFLLDCLVDTAGDVVYLSEQRVIENYLGADAEAACFINNLGKRLTFDLDCIELLQLCRDVHNYSQNTFYRLWTSFKSEYNDKPWLWISGLAAFVLLVLTSVQTYYTIYAYKHPKS